MNKVVKVLKVIVPIIIAGAGAALTVIEEQQTQNKYDALMEKLDLIVPTDDEEE